MQLPEVDPGTGQPDHFSHPSGSGFEIWMLEEAFGEKRDLGTVHFQEDEAITRVAQIPTVEAPVAGEKSRLAEGVEQRDDLLVLNAFSAEVITDQSGGNTPAAQ
jgi:hypothetical protein